MTAILTFGNRKFEQLVARNVKNGNLSRPNNLQDNGLSLPYLNGFKEKLRRQSKDKLIEKIVIYEVERRHFQDSIDVYEWKLKLYADIVMEKQKLENRKRLKKEHLSTIKWDILRDNFDKTFREDSA